MKKLLFGFLAVVTAGLAHGDLFDEAVSRAKTSSADIPSGAAISVVRAVLSRDEVDISAMGRQTVRPSFERFVFVFVDDFPGANWAHPCRYVIFNEDLSAHEVVRQMFPPTLRSRSRGERIALIRVEGGPKPVSLETTVRRVRNYANALRFAAAPSGIDYTIGNPAHSYFLLIAGGADPWDNGIRFWSDTAMYYSTLTLKYKVPKENIVLLVSDGRGAPSKDAVIYEYDDDTRTSTHLELVPSPADLDGDGVADVTGPATLMAVANALYSFNARLTKDDQLTVFLSSHGAQASDTLCDPTCHTCVALLFDPDPDPDQGPSEGIFDEDLAWLTEGIKCPVAFAIETCFSGGFIDDIMKTPNRVIATACDYDQFSFGGEEDFPAGASANFNGATHSCNSWALQFNCAVRGNVPKPRGILGTYPWQDSPYLEDRMFCLAADVNEDRRISFREASDFAALYDEAAPDETPQFEESTEGLGASFFTLKQSVPVSLENPIVRDTAEAASNEMAKAVFTPSAEVETKLGKWTPALRTYCDMFTFDVVPTSDGKWAVEAVLTPEAKLLVAASAQAATRQIPVGDIAALAADGTKDVLIGNCLPGFYYALGGSGSLGGLGSSSFVKATEDKLDVYGPELCGAKGEVTFSEVKKPSETAGFFTITISSTNK